jgi:hypothetical protein
VELRQIDRKSKDFFFFYLPSLFRYFDDFFGSTFNVLLSFLLFISTFALLLSICHLNPPQNLLLQFDSVRFLTSLLVLFPFHFAIYFFFGFWQFFFFFNCHGFSFVFVSFPVDPKILLFLRSTFRLVRRIVSISISFDCLSLSCPALSLQTAFPIRINPNRFGKTLQTHTL